MDSNTNYNEYLKKKTFYEENKDNLFFLPEGSEQPVKCKMICPYPDGCYLLEYTERVNKNTQVRQTIVLAEKDILVLSITAETEQKTPSAEVKVSPKKRNAPLLPFDEFVYFADPASFERVIRCRIIGMSRKNILFVEYVDSGDIKHRSVHASMVFKDYKAAEKAFHDMYWDYLGST
jgi:hypothetical protein